MIASPYGYPRLLMLPAMPSQQQPPFFFIAPWFIAMPPFMPSLAHIATLPLPPPQQPIAMAGAALKASRAAAVMMDFLMAYPPRSPVP